MKEKFLKLKESGLFVMLLMLLCSALGVCDAGAMSADVARPAGGGAVDTAAAVSVTETRVNSEDLVLDTIDEKVAVIRPYDVVLDTISRQIKDVKNSNNQVVRHYAIDVIELATTLSVAYAGGTATQTSLTTADDTIFANDQTIIVDGVKGYKEDGTTVDPDRDLMLYVIEKDTAGHPIVIAINGSGTNENARIIPAIPINTKLIRAGRAGSETQIQTDAYSGVPSNIPQFLQKFMAQVEMTELFKRADAEVDWGFTDAEEEAIFDMKRVANVTFWRGVRRRITSKNSRTKRAEDIYFTEGIWTQAGKEFSFGGNAIDANSIVTLMKESFTGNASGKKKIFIVGSDLLERFEQVEYTRVVYVGAKMQAYGLEFSTIISKFGTLLVAHDQSLDDIGWADKGFVLDPDFLRKWTMGWRVKDFDFRSSGQSDSDGRGLMEICGLVLKNPKAHVRVSFA